MAAKKLKQQFLRVAGNLLLINLLNLLSRTLRITYINKQGVDDLQTKNKNYVLAFWHGTMLIPWFSHKGKKISALVSKSKDGDILTKLLRSWGYNVVRGSSSDGGKVALGILVDFAKNGYIIGITPDGPKGPPNKLKAGAVITAKKGNIPLVMVRVNYHKKYILKSWDKFQIPKPFSKVTIEFSNPHYIPDSLTFEETSSIIHSSEKWMNK